MIRLGPEGIISHNYLYTHIYIYVYAKTIEQGKKRNSIGACLGFYINALSSSRAAVATAPSGHVHCKLCWQGPWPNALSNC